MAKIIITAAVIGAASMAAAFAGYSFAAKSAPQHVSDTVVAAERKPVWVAGAVGRVEPKGGEIRIAATNPGRIAEVIVHLNDKVENGEVLVRLDDEEARYRLLAAEADATARRRERDAQPVTAGREEAKRAEDAVYAAERMLTGARFELDYLLSLKRKGGATDNQIADARQRLRSVRDQLGREQAALGAALSKPGLAAPNRLEAAFTAARAEVAIAESILDKTRVRATSTGTVLQLAAKLGESTGPAAEQPLVVVGDTSSMRVRAELDEIDAGKIRVGQRVIVRNDAYPDRDFEAKVGSIAPSLAAPRLGARGPRRPADVEVLEVMIDLDGSVPLLSGMRVEALFM